MVPGYPHRFIELFAQRGEPALLLDGTIYRRYGHMVVPFGPAEAPYSLSRNDASVALKRLGGMLVRTTAGFGDRGGASEWYAVICRRFVDVDGIRSSNTRSKLRRALRNCEVRRISARELSEQGYDAYRSAHDRYRGAAPAMDESIFRAQVLAADGFDDIVHYWGVFCDGVLAAYSSNYIFGTTEALYATLKFHPAYLKRYTSYALFHEMGRSYLAEHDFGYVNDGFRTVLHESDLQDFMERNFGFEKAHTPVDVSYRRPYGALMRATFPFRDLLSRVDRRAQALYELERAVRVSRKRAVAVG
jgi:hypothetical protein